MEVRNGLAWDKEEASDRASTWHPSKVAPCISPKPSRRRRVLIADPEIGPQFSHFMHERLRGLITRRISACEGVRVSVVIPHHNGRHVGTISPYLTCSG